MRPALFPAACACASSGASLCASSQYIARPFERAAAHAIEDGADVLLPGQTIIAELLWKAGVTRFDDAVVLDPRLPMLRMAEMMVDMRKAGVSASRRGFYWAKPPADLAAALRRFYED